MTPGLRAFSTLVIMLVLIVVFAVAGWRLVSRPFPAKAAPVVCADRTISAGDTLTPVDVTVSVMNTSQREGLAGRTLDAFTVDHFAQGSTATAPKGVSVGTVQVWAHSQNDPAAQLVAGWLPGAQVVVQTKNALPGVTVVVGEGFTQVADKGPTSVKVTAAGTVCSPVLS
jgi:hypothetical protein